MVVHRILAVELARGREMGLAYLRAQAELAVAAPAKVDRSVEVRTVPPADSRCFVCRSNGADSKLFVCWAGEVARGELRKRQIHRIESVVCLGALVLFLAGLFLLVRAVLRIRAEAERQRAFVSDFTHRLKTPLTSILLCAELTRSGRLSPDRVAESTGTIVSEAEKLNGIVDEVLDFMEGARNG